MKQLITLAKARLGIFQHKGIRQIIMYTVLAFFTFFMLAMFNNRLARMDSGYHLITLLILTILLGTFHTWLMARKLFSEFASWAKSLFILGANLSGIILFIAISHQINFSNISQDYLVIYLPALAFFSLPWFFYCTIQSIMAVPPLEFAPIQFDSLKDVVAAYRFAEDKNKGIIWIFQDQFEEMDESGTYWFRTHTPNSIENINLKDLFKGVLSLHNHNLSPTRVITFKKGETNAGWQFYIQRPWLPGFKAINPEKSFKENQVRFKKLTTSERNNLEGVRSDLSKKFRITKIYITRTFKN